MKINFEEKYFNGPYEKNDNKVENKNIKEQIDETLNLLNAAKSFENYAYGDGIESAIYKVNELKERLSSLYQLAKA